METTTIRNSGIDFIRTIAILIMLVSNTLPYFETFIPPDWLRLTCSLAAPLFIFLSGYSVHLSKVREGWAAFIPAIAVFLAAIIVDVVAWRIIPMLEFDVLYLISAGLFINIFLRNSPRITTAVAIIMMLSPIVSQQLHYRFEMDELSLFDPSITLAGWLRLQPLNRFLIDGWFPLLPWLAFALLGSAFALYKEKIMTNRKSILVLAFIGFASLAGIQLNMGLPSMRDGYVEIFYPLNFTHMLCSISWVGVLSLWLIPHSEFFLIGRLFVLGRKSQLVYITHALFLGWLIEGTYQPNTMVELTIVIALLFAIVLVVSTLAEQPRIRSITDRLPLLLKRVLGL